MAHHQPDREIDMTDETNEESADPPLFVFFNELGIIHQLVSARLERTLPGDLKLSQFGVLNHFARLGLEQTPAELSEAFQVTKGAMTNTLNRLEARGLVRIRSNPKDGRSKLVSISAKGKRVRQAAIEALAPEFADFASRFPMSSIEEVLPLLRTVRTILDGSRT